MEQPVTISRQQLAEAVMGQVGQFPELLDQTYVLITPEWLDGDFSSAYYDFLKLYDLIDWEPESNDCEDFAEHAGSVAKALHTRTRRKYSHVPSSITFGLWCYKPEWSTSNHAIRWFAYPHPVDDTHPEGIAIGFYEPDGRKRRVVKLSDTEINSCFKCAA